MTTKKDDEHLYEQYVDDFRNRSCRTPIQKHIILPSLKELQVGIDQNNREILFKAILNIHLIECGVPI